MMMMIWDYKREGDYTEHRNAVKIKKRRIVADYVASVSESGNRDRCHGDSVASLGVNTGL